MSKKKNEPPKKQSRLHRMFHREASTGEAVSAEYAAENPATTVTERIGMVAWRGWVVVLPDGKLLAEAPDDPREMRFASRALAVGWATQPGENVARAKVVVE